LLRQAGWKDGSVRSHHYWSQPVCGALLSLLVLTPWFPYRSLVTALRAAENFDCSHLHSPEVAPLIDTAKVFYVESYFLTHGIESVVFVAKRALIAGKVGRCSPFSFSAPNLSQGFRFESFGPLRPSILWSSTAQRLNQPDSNDSNLHFRPLLIPTL